MERAEAAGVLFPTSVTLSTASPRGVVSARTVLLKGWDEHRLVFESEDYSRKGVELAANPHAAITLFWREVHRQICVTGEARPLPRATSDEMWARRARANQAASIATREGEPIASLTEEQELFAVADAVAAAPGPIARPESYQAYGLVPSTVEFWEGSQTRLHRRVFYERAGGLGAGSAAGWTWRRIQP